MPELPDIELYLHVLRKRVHGATLTNIRLKSAFLLRSVEPPLSALHGKRVLGLERLGKRVVFAFEDELFMVVHLMVAGRFQWKGLGAAVPGRMGLAAFDFERGDSEDDSYESGTLLLTEASKKKRARLHVVRGRAAMEEHDAGGAEPLGMSQEEFESVLCEKNHTVKRALTDPRIFSGIGNAYSDEILFVAKLPPTRWTSRLKPEDIDALHEATQKVLNESRDRLIEEVGEGWPKKVTAFRPEMAVHGKYGEPCPVCAEPVQRIRYADNETNYCAKCQNGGKLLADRGLSRLLKGDWPKTLDALELMKRERKS
ncbi:MAG: DNA-formamidopyrimidine glycosylase family protein [Polyangiales bacterium]